MISTAEIELIGYVGKDPILPKPNEYPNFVTFSVGVSRTWKDKQGKEQKETTWFECNTNSESLAKVIKAYVTQGTGILIKGYPKVKVYIDKSGEAKGSIEVNISRLNLLTSSKEKQATNEISRENYITEIEELSKLDDEIPF
jgi:single stranded DNA-binding protein